MKILVAFERSGVVRRAFAERGHEVVSVDLARSMDRSPCHVQGDARPFLERAWDLVIAHPPCTRLCNSGVRWLHERGLWDELGEAADLFSQCLRANAPRVAVENPVMHRHARELIGRGPDFTVQPWQFGDDFKKRTCFWTRGLEPLRATSDLDGSTAVAAVHRAPPSEGRAIFRALTYPGMARAMAQQWG